MQPATMLLHQGSPDVPGPLSLWWFEQKFQNIQTHFEKCEKPAENIKYPFLTKINDSDTNTCLDHRTCGLKQSQFLPHGSINLYLPVHNIVNIHMLTKMCFCSSPMCLTSVGFGFWHLFSCWPCILLWPDDEVRRVFLNPAIEDEVGQWWREI